MAWIQTATGRAFQFGKPEGFVIEDIANALSKLCRFGGHCRYFYSVAEHCVLMSEHAQRTVGIEAAKAALMHDAAEAYIGDVSAPLKAYLRSRGDAELHHLEDRIQRAICNQFGLIPTPEIKRWDLELLMFERLCLFDTPPPMPWASEEIEPMPGVTIAPYAHDGAFWFFMQRYYTLFGGE